MKEFPEKIVIPYKDGPFDTKQKVYIQEDEYLELERKYRKLLVEHNRLGLEQLVQQLTEVKK